eukprot:CAMPEP_0194394682 /NCGR_PEP_ID=MMETSP0174-20130528/123989_1 /TAXON_ID=216777 /ORGANISM="Proboscia alata, Strain PI-D3" /LENGTH=534 /DNA_ID=CAMNT_0039190505 /DNA_START=104 /DNA_END=1709 /DNA_ORIENTATION=+
MGSCWKRVRRLSVLSSSTKIAPPHTPTVTALASSLGGSTRSSSSLSSEDEEAKQLGSKRGKNAVKLLPSYLTDARSVEQYHPEDCPHGALQLSVAENQMLEDLLVPALSIPPKDGFTSDLIYYQQTQGRPQIRSVMSQFLHRTLKLPTPPNPDGLTLAPNPKRHVPIFAPTLKLPTPPNPDGLTLGAGCNAVLENLCFCLADAGDGVLIPTPYYAAFEFDLGSRAGLNIIPVEPPATTKFSPDDAGWYYPTSEALETAYQNNPNVKILLLSHPNNPLGVCYPKHVLEDILDWAESREVHIVSDEIYGGSVYGEKGEAFTSFLTVASGRHAHGGDNMGIGPYVHLVYALSKDFCLSGLRVGVSYSENEEIALPLSKVNDLCQISSQTQLLVEDILSRPSAGGLSNADADADEATRFWYDEFLNESRQRLSDRSGRLQDCLSRLGVPFLKPDSGMFLWMDLSHYLPSADDGSNDKVERRLYLELVKKYGLLLTPGSSMKMSKEGFFRFVYTAASDDEFDLALQRIETFVTEKGQQK